VPIATLFGRNGYDKLLATACPATPDNGLAILALHAGAKAMGSLSTNPAGLIGSLGHDFISSTAYFYPNGKGDQGNLTNRIINHDPKFLSSRKHLTPS